ncbi:MAG: malonate--CoA ligase [Pseudorhodobacter sp.]
MTNPLYDHLFGRHAASERPFLRLPDSTSISYAEFIQRSGRLAAVLALQGLKPGDRLVAQVEKSPDALALYAACVRAGIIFLPLNTAYTAEELRYFISDSDAALVICAPRDAAVIGTIAADCGAKLLTLDGIGGGSLVTAIEAVTGEGEIADRRSHDIAALLYTSGTTGRSKGAMLTQDNLLSNARVLTEYWRFTDKDILLHALPIFHTHGLFVATNITLAAGGSMLFLPGFDLEEILGALPGATAMMGVPTFYTRLLGDARFTRDLVQHMRLFISGSAPLLAETHIRFEKLTGQRILERYGMTETNMNTSNPYDGERRAGSVGFPLPGVELRIVDPETVMDVAPGEVGQIEIRGTNVFKGYWRMPEKTAAEMREDGFFITGDLGTMDADGYVTIVGRNKDLIISGGYNIYPKEIELVLDDQPGVLESAVIGVPHPDFGETVLGLIIPKPGVKVDLDLLQTAVAASLARFKHPRRLIIIDELPRNTMGKVQKNILRETYHGLFAQG